MDLELKDVIQSGKGVRKAKYMSTNGGSEVLGMGLPVVVMLAWDDLLVWYTSNMISAFKACVESDRRGSYNSSSDVSNE